MTVINPWNPSSLDDFSIFILLDLSAALVKDNHSLFLKAHSSLDFQGITLLLFLFITSFSFAFSILGSSSSLWPLNNGMTQGLVCAPLFFSNCISLMKIWPCLIKLNTIRHSSSKVNLFQFPCPLFPAFKARLSYSLCSLALGNNLPLSLYLQSPHSTSATHPVNYLLQLQQPPQPNPLHPPHPCQNCLLANVTASLHISG